MCNSIEHPKDARDCRSYDFKKTQTKTITLPLDMAERLENKDETLADMELLRAKLLETYADMVF